MSFNIGNGSLNLEDSFLSSHKRFNEAIENISMPSGCDDFLNVSNFTQNPSLLSDSVRSKFSEASDANITLNCTDYLLKEINEGLKAKKLLDKNIEEDISNYKSLLSEVTSARHRCYASKFVVETMKDVFENSSKLPHSLKKKCCQRIRFSSLLRNPDNSELLESFGVDDRLEPLRLTADEKRSIHLALREALNRKITRQKIDNDVILDILGDFTRNAPLPGSTITEENVKMLCLINEIGEAIKSCFEVASLIADTIKELCDYHVQKFQKLHEAEMNCLTSKTKLLELKLKNLNSMIKNAMIQENDSVNNALNILRQKLRTILDESEYSLQKTEAMRQSYDNLKGTKFDEILREFVEVRESHSHKVWALKQMKKSR